MDNISFIQSNSRSMRKYSSFQYLFTGIGVIALLFFFSLADADDIKERWFMLLAITLALIVIFKSLFTKRAAWTRADISLTGKGLLLKGTGKTIPLPTLHLDIYSGPDGTFRRYHLWDKKRTLAIFSVEEDDLLRQLSGQDGEFDVSLRNFTETEVGHNRSNHEITVLTEEGPSFFYNIDTGRYSFKSPKQEELKSMLPEYYVYDPVYTLRQ